MFVCSSLIATIWSRICWDRPVVLAAKVFNLQFMHEVLFCIVGNSSVDGGPGGYSLVALSFTVSSRYIVIGESTVSSIDSSGGLPGESIANGSGVTMMSSSVVSLLESSSTSHYNVIIIIMYVFIWRLSIICSKRLQFPI